MQCINVKLKAKFAIKQQAVISEIHTTYLRMPLFGMIPVVTLFVVCAGAVITLTEMHHLFFSYFRSTYDKPMTLQFDDRLWQNDDRFKKNLRFTMLIVHTLFEPAQYRQ